VKIQNPKFRNWTLLTQHIRKSKIWTSEFRIWWVSRFKN